MSSLIRPAGLVLSWLQALSSVGNAQWREISGVPPYPYAQNLKTGNTPFCTGLWRELSLA
jgi:hypothetical protein